MSEPIDRARLHEAVEAGERLAPRARRVLGHRDRALSQAAAARQRLLSTAVGLRHAGLSWRVLPLGPEDGDRLGQLAAATGLTRLTSEQETAIRDLAQEVPRAVDQTRVLRGLRRVFSLARQREAAEPVARRLLEGYALWGGEQVGRLLDQMEAQGREPALPVALEQALSPALGLVGQLVAPGQDLSPGAVKLAGQQAGESGAASRSAPPRRQAVVPVGELSALPAAVRLVAPVIAQEPAARQAALDAGEAVRADAAARLLALMPVDRLREATRERLRVNALVDAGITTVGAALGQGNRLARIDGVGELTARRMLGAAETLRALAQDDATVTVDPHDRTPQAARLLTALHTWEVVRQAAKAADLVALAQTLQPLADRMEGATHLAVASDGPTAGDLRALALPLLEQAHDLQAALHQARDEDPWDDFLRRPADYYALLSELGLVEETGTHGDLPDDVVEAVRAQDLDTSLLRVSLRGYQSFAARFALVQRKVLIGDEMGLGKTIEALAVLTHHAAEGGRWFLVVCPAAVVTNWVREVGQRTDLAARRVHGNGRDEALGRWRTEGGVAVTTYTTLGLVWPQLDGFELDGLVVDEAHYVKNPEAKRSQRVGALAARTQHVMLLTGTPLENRTAEFEALVGYLRPDLREGLQGRERSAADFRRAVAPVYLRRNLEDVLVELPDLVEVDEWLELSSADETAYRDAVAEGNFMAMRRAAFAAGDDSAKLQRLVELVEEAEDNGRRLLVFSYFRDVLDQVARALPGPVFGPVTGSVPAAERQRIVDDFGRAEGGAALVAQIQAGGVGLNIQAASVVVLCEPQVKPTTEWQAVARARRMGQLETVQVHRLLAEDSVDERMVELLSGKSEIFHQFARVSETAQAAPEAYDVSEADLARQVVAAERERLFPGGVMEPASSA
ncbi:DEAD/DEAH box helicase [Ornithinimicrobium sufpigmenti]|uniref:DEAD/DEAH box helicase n=1 Tax=Ornithinimicrobium sufpigmenti TaxID=2508882 RepID=UPI001036DB0A|nr:MULTISPECIES: DEAD/DEAH box helicase [unclassified Ornithinimicrobium]